MSQIGSGGHGWLNKLWLVTITLNACWLSPPMIETPFPAYRGDLPYLFVCYAHADAAMVFDEMAWLNESGIRLWYDDGVRVGSVWRRVLAEALEGASGLIFMQTSQSVQSEFCLNEIRFALDEEKPVFVVTLQSCKLPAELRLSLGDRQALIKANHSVAEYRSRLIEVLVSCVGDPEPTTQAVQPAWLRRRRQHRERRLFTSTVMFVDTGEPSASQSAADDMAANGAEILAHEGSRVLASFDSAQVAARYLMDKPRLWRVGLSAGDLLFEDGIYHGGPVNEARTLLQHAAPGEILGSAQLSALLDPTKVSLEQRQALPMGSLNQTLDYIALGALEQPPS